MRFPPLPVILVHLALLPNFATAAPPEVSPAHKAMVQGELAMERDRFEEAIGHFQVSLRLDPNLVQNHLSIAAAHLALGRQEEALPPLAAYLAARPHHFLIRWHYAEVLLAADHHDEARIQLDRFVAEAQEHPRIAEDQLVACHTRLMEIAEHQGDDYGERLHRGIGLYLLAKKRAELGDGGSRRQAEELLCKAAAELTLARLHKPKQARPCWYLYGVWTCLGQRQPASRWLRAAERSGPMNDLTPAEQRELHLAASERKRELWKK
jgi:predicted Zn-dependent protease